MYTQHRSTNQYQPLSLKLLAIVEIDGFSDLFFHSAWLIIPLPSLPPTPAS